MEEQFVPYEIGLLLKNKGFNESCLAAADNKVPFELYRFIDIKNSEEGRYNPNLVTLPLWQQVFDWFEDNHNIIFCRNINYSFKNNNPISISYNYKLVRVGMTGEPIFTEECTTRLKANITAIKKALTHILSDE